MRARRIPLSHGTHVTGWHPMRPAHGVVQFESAPGQDCIGFLARHPRFLRIRSQPTTISFVRGGYARRYTSDFLVGFESDPDALNNLGLAQQIYVEVRCAEQAAPTATSSPRAWMRCGTQQAYLLFCSTSASSAMAAARERAP